MLDSRKARVVGLFLLWGLVCFGAGNFHVTKDAVDGSAAWWAKHEKADLTAEQRQAWQQCIKSYWQ